MERLPDAPLVSVVVPTLNRAGFLRQAIESVVTQDWPHIEMLVMDGGSDDGTAAVLEEYAAAHPERVRPSVHPGLGQLEKLDIGFKEAGGDLVIAFGDDDLLLPGAIARLVQGFREHPDALVVYPDYHHMDTDGRVYETTRYPSHTLLDSVRLHICAPAFALFRRTLVDELGGWNVDLGTVADWDFWWRASLLGEFHHVFEPLASLRVHRGTLSGARTVELGREHVRLVDEFYSRPDVPPELLAVRAQAYRTAHIYAAEVMEEGTLNQMGDRYLVEDTIKYVNRAIEFEVSETDPNPLNSTLRLQAVVRRLLRAIESHEQEVDELRKAIEAREGAIAELKLAISMRDELLVRAGLDPDP